MIAENANPNFKKNLTPEVEAKLDAWFGDEYEVIIIWKDSFNGSPLYFAVVKTEDKVHMARLFKIGDKLEISIDEQKEVAS